MGSVQTVLRATVITVFVLRASTQVFRRTLNLISGVRAHVQPVTLPLGQATELNQEEQTWVIGLSMQLDLTTIPMVT